MNLVVNNSNNLGGLFLFVIAFFFFIVVLLYLYRDLFGLFFNNRGVLWRLLPNSCLLWLLLTFNFLDDCHRLNGVLNLVVHQSCLWLERANLHQFKIHWVWIRLKLINDKCVAHNVLLEPNLLILGHLIDHGLIRDRLIFLFQKVSDVISEKVVGNYESLLAFITLISCIEKAVRVVIILRRCPTKYSLPLQFDEVVYIIWQLLHLRKNQFEGCPVYRSRILLSLFEEVPLLQYLISVHKIVWQEA